MNKIVIRPRFNLEVELSRDEIIRRISEEVKICKGKCEVNLLRSHILFKIPEEMQHFWSPELSIEIDSENNKSFLRCVLGPRSTVWTMFATFYGFSIFIGLIGLVLGFSQWAVGMSPSGFWLVPLCLILIILAYIIAITGQKLSHDEMVFLRTKLDRALNVEE